MTDLHGLVGGVLLVLLGGLATLVGVAAIRGGSARWTDRARQGVLAIVVAEAAIGLALVVRGAAPAEWLHWLYGGLLVAVLLAPAALEDRVPTDRRAPLLAVSAAIGAVLAWRLGASG